jgi:hypothetical protein
MWGLKMVGSRAGLQFRSLVPERDIIHRSGGFWGEINEGRILRMTKGNELSHNIRWSIEPTAHSSKAVDH